MNRVLLCSMCVAVAALLKFTPAFADEPAAPAPIVVSIDLEPLWIYDIEVSSTQTMPSITLASPILADGSVLVRPGAPYAEGQQGKGITKMGSKMRFMPEVGQGGPWKLSITPADNKTAITRYKLTVDAQVTR